MMDMLKYGEIKQFYNFWTPIVFAYIGGLVILFAIGAFVQFKFVKVDERNKQLEEGIELA